MLYPAEPPLPRGPVRAIEVDYPDAGTWLGMPRWLVLFFVLSIVFAFALKGRMGVFRHPFRGQTMAAGGSRLRRAHMHRYHLLDRLPFHERGRFEFEAWGLGRGDMDWITSAMWYTMPEEDTTQQELGMTW